MLPSSPDLPWLTVPRLHASPHRRAKSRLQYLLVALLCAYAAAAAAHLPTSEQIQVLETSQAGHPDDPELLLQRSAIERSAGHPKAAATAARRALRLGATPSRARLALAYALLDADDAKLALATLETALDQAPGDPTLIRARGQARRARGDFAGAARDLAAALDSTAQPSPDDILEAMSVHVASGNEPGALAVADRIYMRRGAIASIELVAIRLEQKAGRNAAALARLDRLLAQSPRHLGWLAQRAAILDSLDRGDEAVRSRERALAILRERPRSRRPERLAALERELDASLSASRTPKGDPAP